MREVHTRSKHAEQALSAQGFRVTRGRVKLLQELQRAGKPLSISSIQEAMKGFLHQANVYRTLTDLTESGIVKRVDLNTGVAHFEFTPGHPHHHHVICTNCGALEDVEDCSVEALQKTIVERLRTFSTISNHRLEFFGQCVRCA